MAVTVLQSTTVDGSMYNRHDLLDQEVIENRNRFLQKNGLTTEQTSLFLFSYEGEKADYCRYQSIDANDKGRGVTNDDIIRADAIVTTTLNHALFLPVADCIAATLYDPVKKVLMLTHLGRHSLEQQGGARSIEYLSRQFGSQPADIHVWLSSAAGKDSYQIWALDNKGMKEATFEQLAAAGINHDNITDTPADTTSDTHYFSYSEFLKGNRETDGDHCMVAMMTD